MFKEIETNLQTITFNLLKKYAWDNRNKQEDLEIPESMLQMIDNRIQNSFYNDKFRYVGKIPYYLFSNLIGIQKYVIASDDDSLIGVVGPPGTGKTTTAMVCAKVLDPEFNAAESVIFTMKQFKDFLKKVTSVYDRVMSAREQGLECPNPYAGKPIILDEGVNMMFSGDSQSKDGKDAQKLFSIIRALNIVFFVCITNWKKISDGVKDDRFAATIRLPAQGHLEFRNRPLTNKIRLKNKVVEWGHKNFSEQIGYIHKKSTDWSSYSLVKAQFLNKTIHGVEDF